MTNKTTTLRGNPHLYMMVGLPGSGKSTVIARLVAHHKRSLGEENYKYVILSTDKYIEAVAAREKKDYNEVFKDEMPHAEKALLKELKDAIKDGADIFWDQTNLSVKAREKKLAKIPDTYYKVAVLVEVSDEQLQNQLDNRVASGGKYIGPKVVNDMRKTYEKPTRDEGFNDIMKV